MTDHATKGTIATEKAWRALDKRNGRNTVHIEPEDSEGNSTAVRKFWPQQNTWQSSQQHDNSSHVETSLEQEQTLQMSGDSASTHHDREPVSGATEKDWRALEKHQELHTVLLEPQTEAGKSTTEDSFLGQQTIMRPAVAPHCSDKVVLKEWKQATGERVSERALFTVFDQVEPNMDCEALMTWIMSEDRSLQEMLQRQMDDCGFIFLPQVPFSYLQDALQCRFGEYLAKVVSLLRA